MSVYMYECSLFVKILFQMNFTILSHCEVSHLLNTFYVYSKPKVTLHCLYIRREIVNQLSRQML